VTADPIDELRRPGASRRAYPPMMAFDVVTFEEEDESPFVGLLRVEGA
jgi:hypothetical protein